MRWGQLASVVLAVATVLSGCDSGGSGGPPETPSVTPPPVATTTPPSPADQLRARARALGRTPFHATYRARRTHPLSAATLVVDHTARSVRVDVTTGGTTATLIVTPHASYACSRSRHDRACFRVARAGQPVRAPFNLAPQTVFTTDVTQLASHTARYRVASAGRRAATASVPAATCFSVHRRQVTREPRAPGGTYCFADSGVLTSVTYSSGSTLKMRSVRLTAPAHTRFHPYASATPLP